MYAAAITVFPGMFEPWASAGIAARAIGAGALRFESLDLRDYAEDRHATVDDRPYGGGPGMVMKAPPLERALAAARRRAHGPVTVVFMSPQGQRFTHARARHLSQLDNIVFVAGRYEGVDERFVEREVDIELSLGDFVMAAGELAVMVVLDAVTRLLPGAVGNPESLVAESHADGLLDHPHYTRPEVFCGAAVPAVLLSGNHGAVARWRRKQSLGRTWRRRPDLLARRPLAVEDQRLLKEFIADSAE